MFIYACASSTVGLPVRNSPWPASCSSMKPVCARNCSRMIGTACAMRSVSNGAPDIASRSFLKSSPIVLPSTEKISGMPAGNQARSAQKPSGAEMPFASPLGPESAVRPRAGSAGCRNRCRRRSASPEFLAIAAGQHEMRLGHDRRLFDRAPRDAFHAEDVAHLLTEGRGPVVVEDDSDIACPYLNSCEKRMVLFLMPSITISALPSASSTPAGDRDIRA